MWLPFLHGREDFRDWLPFLPWALTMCELSRRRCGKADLGEIIDILSQRPERFIIFCDDLSFEDGESGYKTLKTALDGSIAAHSEMF